MNVSLPKVSIVLPTYNGARYLRQSIDSCLRQTHKNFELIIVDDHSTDETPQIVRSYDDARIRLLRHETNKRLPRALNTGFAEAGGEYLTWTSDDNLYAENAIERMLNFLRQEQCGLVYCDFYLFKNDNLADVELVRCPDEPAFDRVNCVKACFLYSRQVRDTVGDYDPDTELCEDYDYWIRVSQAFQLRHLAEPLYFYRGHGESLYSRRFWEVELVKVLVRLKYGIMDVRQVADALVTHMARRRFSLGPHRLRKLTARLVHSREIRRKLTDFKEGRMSFRRVRSDLNAVINRGVVEGQPWAS